MTTNKLEKVNIHNESTNFTLSDDDLTEQAKQQFPYHTKVFQAHQLNIRNARNNHRLSPMGHQLFDEIFEQNYMNYKNVLNYVADHPQIRNIELKRDPLFICGLPRTGTTLLYNLLACDP